MTKDPGSLHHIVFELAVHLEIVNWVEEVEEGGGVVNEGASYGGEQLVVEEGLGLFYSLRELVIRIY